MPVEGATPSAPGAGQISIYGKLDGRLYTQDSGSNEIQLLTNETALSDLFVQAPITKAGPTSSPTIGIGLANASNDGAMTSGDFVKLTNATNLNNPSTLVERDASGNFVAGTITANLVGNADSCTTIPALSGSVTSSGASNVTTIAPGVITNAMINASAGISLTKLAQDPLARSNHTGDQLASTISNFTSAVEALFGNATFDAQVLGGLSGAITDTQIALGANIALAKLATDPLARGNHTGDQTHETISDWDTEVDARIPIYLASNGITNAQVDALANIAISKLEEDPRARSTHTGNQLASTISDFSTAVDAALTGGNGIDVTSGTITAEGVAGQITVSGSGIGIDATYVGQSSITTLGAITTGSWAGTAIPLLYGGTGAASAIQASINLRSLEAINTTTVLSSTISEVITVDSTSGNVTLSLPAASSSNNLKFTVKRIDNSVNTIEISPNGADEIDGSNSNLGLTNQFASVTIQCDGTDWWVTAKYLT